MDSREEDGQEGGKVQRACDGCRARKIKCDRAQPCSNCRTGKLTCITTAPASKPQRQRIHISEEYEKKIDRIEDRLSRIENILEVLSAKLGNADFHKELSDRSSQPRSHKPNIVQSSPASTPAPYEGETTLNRQSEFARELLEKAVGSTPSIGENAEIKNALISLQDMVMRQGQYTNATPSSNTHPFFNRNLADIDTSKLEIPPWEVVNEIIEKASYYPTMCFAVVFPFLKMRNMKEIIKETYSCHDEATVGRRILVFGILYNLFIELGSYPVVESKVEGYLQHAATCKLQFEVAVSQLDLYIPATYENILAMLIASTFAIELCKPSLCWVLISTAASLSQTLGYHRLQTMVNDSEDDRNAKIHAFWFIYLMDRTLSLRLGRAPIIQDWDLSLPYPTMDNDRTHFDSFVQMGTQGTSMLLYWIKLAQIQGRVYKDLFSPAASLQTPEKRAQCATELVEAMNQIWAQRGEASAFDFVFMDAPPPGLDARNLSKPPDPMTMELPSAKSRPNVLYATASQQSIGGNPTPRVAKMEGSFTDIGDIFYLSDVVVHYSTCTLIQRAISPDNVTFDEGCLASARAALLAHERCHKKFNVKGNEDLWSGYIHWSILQAPFTPFIVIFCNAVLHCDPSDLSFLADFVQSLESCRTVSEGADKLYKMCHLFLQVAKLYVEAKTKESQTATTSSSQAPPNQNFITSNSNRDINQPQTTGFEVDVNTLNQFDPYLSALGLMPNSTWPISGFHSQMNSNTAGSDQGTFQQSQGFDLGAFTTGGVGVDGFGVGPQSGSHNNVQDWFSGSRYLMNLMEEDIQMPDFNF